MLTELESNTQYVLELYVIEYGEAVGVTTTALGSAVSSKPILTTGRRSVNKYPRPIDPGNS